MRKNKGFSLVELMVSAGIMAILVAGIYGVLRIGDIAYQSDMGLVDLQQQVRGAMDGILREIRQIDSSQPVTISGTGNDISFSITDDVTNPSSPVTYTVRYYLNNNRIIRKNPAATGAENVLIGNISNLCFYCNICGDNCANPVILHIQITAQKTVKQRLLSFSLTEKVSLRNE